MTCDPVSAAGKLDHGHEEVIDLADHVQEALKIDRLGDVGVGVQVVAAQDVLFGIGGGQHDDRDALQVGV